MKSYLIIAALGGALGFSSCIMLSPAEEQPVVSHRSGITDFAENFVLPSPSRNPPIEWVCSVKGGNSLNNTGADITNFSRKYYGYYNYLGDENVLPLESITKLIKDHLATAPNFKWTSQNSIPKPSEATYHKDQQFGKMTLEFSPNEAEKIVRVSLRIEEKAMKEK